MRDDLSMTTATNLHPHTASLLERLIAEFNFDAIHPSAGTDSLLIVNGTDRFAINHNRRVSYPSFDCAYFQCHGGRFTIDIDGMRAADTDEVIDWLKEHRV